MTKLALSLFLFLSFALAKAQNSNPLPLHVYTAMTETVTSADIILLQGEGGSLFVDKSNIGILKDFISTAPAEKINSPQTASLLCQVNGQEYISGSIYLGADKGAVVFNYGGKEYVNELNLKGTEFFRNMTEQ